MTDQVTLTGTVQRIAVRWKTGRGVVVIDTDHGDAVRATGDIAHLSRGDKVQALGRMKHTTRWGDEFAARAIMPTDLLPALAEIEQVIDRLAKPRPARGAVLGLVIVLGKQAAAVMAHNPFLPVVDPDREVKGWGYGSRSEVCRRDWHTGRRRGTRRGRRAAPLAAASGRQRGSEPRPVGVARQPRQQASRLTQRGGGSTW